MAEHTLLPILYTLAAGATSGVASYGLYRLTHPKTELVHSIHRGLCVGCDKCVQRCPTQVLELDANNKAHVARPDDCIECRQCESVCKPQALVMHRRGEPPPEIERPDLDEAFQVRGRPGLYLIGHAAGVPMVKNAVNLGRAAVEHAIRSRGFVPLATRPGPAAADIAADIDVAIVGSGPAGLSAALSCAENGLSFVIFERSSLTNSTVQSYPTGKNIHSVPADVRCLGRLPMPNDQISVAELTTLWQAQLDRSGVLHALVKPTQVLAIDNDRAPAASRPEGAPRFLLRVEHLSAPEGVASKQTYRAQRVIMAIGESGPKRALGVPGEGHALVRDALGDANAIRSQRVLIVGGGDTAVEAAVQLSAPALNNRVALSVRRRRADMKASLRNLEALDRRVRERLLMVLYDSGVVEIQPQAAVLDLRAEKRQRTLELDAVYKLIGNEPATDWLKRQGVRFVWVRHDRVTSQPTDRLVEGLLAQAPPPAVIPPSPAAAAHALAASVVAAGSQPVDVAENRLRVPSPDLLQRTLEPVPDAALSSAARARKTQILKRRGTTLGPGAT